MLQQDPHITDWLVNGELKMHLGHPKTSYGDTSLTAPTYPCLPQTFLGPKLGAAPCLLQCSEQDFHFPTRLDASGLLVCFSSEWEMCNEKLFKQLMVQGNSRG